jgi:hypothetical protein
MSTITREEVIGASSLGGKAVHNRLHDARNGGMERGAGLAGLEEDIGILCCAANDRPIRTEGVLTVLNDVFVVEKSANGLIRDGLDLADFV